MMKNNIHNKKCFNNHLGAWMIEPEWFCSQVKLAKLGLLPLAKDLKIELVHGNSRDEGEKGRNFDVTENGIAIIDLIGALQKGVSKFDDTTSTVLARRMIREAANDDEIRGILLRIDSPGGTASGTMELADDVNFASTKKPIFAFGEDLVASAAFWIASQVDFFIANPMAQIGSIGTVLVLEDTSKKAEMEGIQVHVIATGPLKGAFADGAPITDEQLASLQTRIDDINKFFLAGVAKGRDMTPESVAEIADGRVMIAAKAKKAGLIDKVGSFADALNLLDKQIRQTTVNESAKSKTKQISNELEKLGF